ESSQQNFKVEIGISMEQDGEDERQAPIGKRNVVIPVAAHGACRHALSFELKAGERRRSAWEEVLLDATGLVLLLVQVLYLAALMLDALRVIDRHRDMAGEGLQNFDLCAGEGVQIVVRRTEHPDDPVAHFQGNDDL